MLEGKVQHRGGHYCAHHGQGGGSFGRMILVGQKIETMGAMRRIKCVWHVCVYAKFA